MLDSFKELMVGLIAGVSLLAIPAATAHAAVGRTTPVRSPAADAPLPGFRPVPHPPASAQALTGRSATATPALPPCYYNVGFYSLANGQWVSAEVDYTDQYYGMLRARAPGIGPWETFSLCLNDVTGNWNIWSVQSGYYVSAELGDPPYYYGMLRARATSLGPWEQFNLFCDSNGRLVIQSAANGDFVSAEIGSDYTDGAYGMLRARATEIGPWEEYLSSVNIVGC